MKNETFYEVVGKHGWKTLVEKTTLKAARKYRNTYLKLHKITDRKEIGINKIVKLPWRGGWESQEII